MKFSGRFFFAVINIRTIAMVSFGFGVSSSLHQSPFWIKVSLMMLCVTLSRCAGPENLRLLAASKTGYHRSCGF
jgi:hypothetical protein